jgi:hypothetical protein
MDHHFVNAYERSYRFDQTWFKIPTPNNQMYGDKGYKNDLKYVHESSTYF